MVAETFLNAGVDMVSADRNRVQGHMLMKEAMAPIALKDKYVKSVYDARKGQAPGMLPGFMIFDTCEKVISDIRDIQADEKNVNDCAKDPHEITHNPDMCRYYIISRVLHAEKPVEVEEDYEEDRREDYESYMTGGEPTASYIAS
jgi:phage terminase large subunit